MDHLDHPDHQVLSVGQDFPDRQGFPVGLGKGDFQAALGTLAVPDHRVGREVPEDQVLLDLKDGLDSRAFQDHLEDLELLDSLDHLVLLVGQVTTKLNVSVN